MSALSIEARNIRLKFPGEPSLLFKDLSFAVPRGQKVLLLGPSGCGKSTLLQVLSGIIPLSLELPLKYDHLQIPSSWGFVFQDPDTQFCMPYVDEELAFVLENLSVPRTEMEPLIRKVLADVGLYFDQLHIPIHNLSQGMKQRLALASVLLLQPQVLFLDEPSAMLDPEGTEQIWETVKSVSSSRTVIIVEHKIEQVAGFVDRVVLFNDSGEIIADGPAEHIFRSCQQELIDYGIWYPGVWNDYAASKSYGRILQRRNGVRRIESREQEGQPASEPVLFLDNFQGYRGDESKIYVPEAEVQPGDWIAITGPNGAGKSTLLLSLMQILQTEGTYVLNGERIVQGATGKRWWKKWKRTNNGTPSHKIAFVFQNPELQFLTNSLYEEMAYSLRVLNQAEAQIDGKVRVMLKQFQLTMDVERHPYQLSVGQKRRLSVASAMITDKPVLLLDEPTFGQDARNTFSILETLEELRSQGTTILMVTHDPYAVKHFANKVWRVEEGELTAMNPIEEWERHHDECLVT